MGSSNSASPQQSAIARFDRTLFSEQAILKACYWISRDFSCEIVAEGASFIRVTISPRQGSSIASISDAKDCLLQSVSDFALREKIEDKTSSIRDLLLAKAFSEAGVLEDPPSGIFGDKIEEEKPEGMFKILSSSET